jgi:phospholipid/cholesterol/gamma-HCH transport system substrate-binding protein
MKTTSSLVKLAIFALVTIVTFGTLAATIANISFGSRSTYRAVFSDVTGLAKGQDVRIAGVRVGEVSEIGIDKDRTSAVVDFAVDEKSVLTRGTIATVKYRNLIGERYLALGQGAGPATVLRDGETLARDHTRSALDLTVLFNGFKPLFAALSPKDVNELSGEIIAVLQGEGGNVNSLLSHTASLTSTLADRDQLIGRTITNLNAVLGTVDAHDKALGDLLDQLQRFVSGLSQDRAAIGSSLTNINNVAGQTADLLTKGRPAITADVANLGSLVTLLNKPASTAAFEKFLRTTPAKLETLTRTATYGSWFNFYLCRFNGKVILPNGATTSPSYAVTSARCAQ